MPRGARGAPGTGESCKWRRREGRVGSGLAPGCRAALSPPAPGEKGALGVVDMRRFAFFLRPVVLCGSPGDLCA